MQHNIFDFLYPKYKITKPIRLTELFAGYGSQALALKYLNMPFEHNAICEWAVNSIIAYKELHFSEDNTNYSKPYTHDQLIDLLVNYGISQDYNKPMTKEQIARKNESWCRKVYNCIISTHNLVDVSKAHLEFDPTYCNILTYSFPCQDLSLAGKMEGMHDTSTRSGLLWEVERILSECKNKPDILLMENVPQVHGVGNVENFNKWQLRLEKMGYKNYWQDLNARDYGVPQNRNRCFMVSILGDYSYSFPHGEPLKLRLKDLLEDNVSEKYYLSQKMINCFMSDGTGNYPRRERFLQNIGRENQDVGNSVTTLVGNRPTDNFVLEYGNKALNETLKNNQVEDGDFIDAYNKKVKKDVAGTITTRVSESNNTFIAQKLLKEQLCDELIEQGVVKEGDVVNHSYSKSRMEKPTVANCDNPDCSPTLTTRPDTLGVVVPAIPIKNAIKKGYLLAEDGDGVDISGRMEYHRETVQKGLAQTITTAGGSNVGVVVVGNYIYNLFFTIFNLCCIIDTKEKDKYERSRELLQILWEEIRKKEIWQEIRRFISIQEKKILQSNLYENELYEDRKSQSRISSSPSNSEKHIESITNREKMLDMWKNWKTRYTPQRWELSEQQFRQFNLFMQELSYEATQRETSMQDMWETNERFRVLQQTLFKIQEIWGSTESKIQNGLRIRKLSPRECWRLMGVDDSDYDKVAKNQSEASLYHLAGDSIVVNVLMAIFKELL